jgi:hypothetical protein
MTGPTATTIREGPEHSGPMGSRAPPPPLGFVAEESGEKGKGEASADADSEEGPGLGQEFKLQWLCTERLPFGLTRHIRNPWNHDREIKVSRDGTELEPSAGQALLEEWRLYQPAK